MLVAIDPGTDSGWALLSFEAGLLACGLGDPRECELHRVVDIDEVWIEHPIVYPRSPSPPNDIAKLAFRAGEWSGVYKTLGITVETVFPVTWKGNVDKAKHHPRVWAALDPREQGVLDQACRGMAASKRHNVIDAVGIAVWVRERRK